MPVIPENDISGQPISAEMQALLAQVWDTREYLQLELSQGEIAHLGVVQETQPGILLAPPGSSYNLSDQAYYKGWEYVKDDYAKTPAGALLHYELEKLDRMIATITGEYPETLED